MFWDSSLFVVVTVIKYNVVGREVTSKLAGTTNLVKHYAN